ncbi:MAG: hypothetical protein FD133_1394 [Erysipelotrichaceae bacterium]|nr:MAG: hypothetical protein FD179_501 [Erysipelotrichaceae bacterium]TXT17405.1 MAG: hypothetical protein FD133_1394 [Erysipelotrichaceae bacterium]
MSYTRPHRKKRKLKIFRLVILCGIIVLLGLGSLWTFNTLFKKDPQQENLDDVLVEMKGTYTRKLIEITNPFEYTTNRLEKVKILGKEIDLVALYNKYGILYYLAEPLTEEEINAQFLEIYLFMKPIFKEINTRDYTSEKRIDMFGHEYSSSTQYLQVAEDFINGLIVFAIKMNESTDSTFNMFDRSFIYDDIRDYVLYKEPEGVFMRMQDKPATITRYERELFVKMFKVMAIMHQNLYAKYGITYKCDLCPVPKPAK